MDYARNAAALRNTTIVNDSQGDTPAIQTPGVWRVRLAVVLALVAMLHIPSLFNPFVTDDFVYLATGRDLTWSGISEVLTSGTLDQDASGVWWTPNGVLPFYRPLAILTFAIEYRLWGLQPFGYHLTNLLLHLLCTFLVWRLARRLFAEPTDPGGHSPPYKAASDVPTRFNLRARATGRLDAGPGAGASGSDGGWMALAAAAIFAIHPAHTEAVLWISCRFDLLVCACVLGSVLAYLRWRDGGRFAFRWAVLAIACFILGLGCKETALVLPAVLLVAEWLGWVAGPNAVRSLTRPQRARPSPARLPSPASLLVFGAVMAGLAVAYMGLRFALFGGLGTLPPPYGVDLSSPSVLGVILRTAAMYVLDFVLFIHVDGIYLDKYWAAHLWQLLTLVLVAGVVIVWGWRLAGRSRAFRVGVAWSMLFAAPALLAMPGERNIYLALVGVALAAGSVLAALTRRVHAGGSSARRLRGAVTAVAALCVVIVTVEHGVMWRVSRISQRVFDDLLVAFPDPPPDARIYVVNQCPLNSGGFTTAVKLFYNREDVVACALALAPQLEGTSTDTVYRTGPSSIKVVRRNGVFFQSFIEKFLLFSEPESSLAESARRVDLELLTTPDSGTPLNEFEFRLPYPLDDDRLRLFTWDNRHVRTISDLIWRAEWPRLIPCRPETLPASVVRR